METGEDMRIPDVLSGLWNNWKQNVYVETQHKQHVWDTVRKKLFKLTLKYIWKLRLQEENQTAECHLPGAILSELQLVSQETFLCPLCQLVHLTNIQASVTEQGSFCTSF